MASLDDLATVAAATETEAPADADDAAGAEAPAKKRAKKATPLEMAQRQVNTLTEKICEAEGLVAVAAAKGAMATQKERKKAKALADKLPKLRADLITAKMELQNKQAQADAAAALEQAKAAARSEKEEATRAMT